MKSLPLIVALLLASAALARPSTDITISLPPMERPEGHTAVMVIATVTNTTTQDIAGVYVNLEAEGPTVLGGQSDENWVCTALGAKSYRCTAAVVRAGASLPLKIYLDPVIEGNFLLTAEARWPVPYEENYTAIVRTFARFPRTVAVTHLGDAGPGSLRAAIEYVNDVCKRDGVPCEVRFHQPGAIILNTPLPPITGDQVSIVGFGVTLEGAALAHGHGLEIHGHIIQVHGLTIIGFPWDGIALVGSRSGVLSQNQIYANGSRGISLNERETNDVGYYEITQNTIAGNVRSGIFIESGYTLDIIGNEIEQNGASGIYAGPRAGWLEIHRNTISDNAHFGIAVAREVNNYRLVDNSIFRNAILGIDRGLDGFSGYDFDDNNTLNAKIPPPRILSATVDAAGTSTTITGTYHDNDGYGSFEITLYAGNGEVVLGHTTVRNGTFTFTVPRNLFGDMITATGQRELNLGWSGAYSWTSEFAEPVVVK